MRYPAAVSAVSFLLGQTGSRGSVSRLEGGDCARAYLPLQSSTTSISWILAPSFHRFWATLRMLTPQPAYERTLKLLNVSPAARWF
ncbi:uncharacterized protein PHACADRAFT_248049 [Phanerochaete carnosa HHB-10118-sp]|uniref:Uncharacterized protein n=1 Tax=Phanerochaete carnosa (strain HHB-10118-sp) TaxID=650164 RepID=K5VEK3_PHACS|nr:uncharacterized protein PHACADRAFT_248049 [Phanerochaete carnosa HHB-10118-sp]EKM61441.1 hypothetical protein PHACADRAFT_248049 [Phanerochaete carnosa HHB-10118-sp]